MYEYFNQPGQNPHNQTELVKAISRERLSRTAFLLAILSVILSRTLLFSLILAGCSFMLAVLSVKGGEKPRGRSLYAMLIAAFAVIISFYIMVSAFTQFIIPFLRDPAFRSEINAFYMENFGYELNELMAPLIELFGR